MYDATFIESCFDNLVNSFNAHNSYEFLSSIYLTNTENVSYIGSLEKLVYTIGDTSEIYTRNERNFIEKIVPKNTPIIIAIFLIVFLNFLSTKLSALT